jgi:hypothetical protein
MQETKLLPEIPAGERGLQREATTGYGHRRLRLPAGDLTRVAAEGP